MDFRARLREEIAYSGMTNREVAEKSEITKRALDSYVSSQSCMPSADVAVRLAKTLNTSVEYLVTGEQNSVSSKSKENLQKLVRAYSALSENQKKFLLAVADDMKKIL
jgi:transcriptional regulator with XRE-family HTH domain